jgi:hypothetical protein
VSCCMLQLCCRARAHLGAFGLSAVAIAAMAIPAPAVAGEVGREKVGHGSDRLRAGAAHTFRHRATASGPISRLSLYLARRSTASKLQLGLYANAKSRPGRRLASCTVDGPVADSWNSCQVSPVQVIAGRPYWTAILQPHGSTGKLRVRGVVRGGAAS